MIPLPKRLLPILREMKKQSDSPYVIVGYHGSDTSTTYPFREIMPTYVVISVGKDNTYGHPTDDTHGGNRNDSGAQ